MPSLAALDHTRRSGRETEVVRITVQADAQLVTWISVDGDWEELLAVDALDLLDGEDTQGAVRTVHAGELFQNDALDRFERKILDVALDGVQRVVHLHVNAVVVDLS